MTWAAARAAWALFSLLLTFALLICAGIEFVQGDFGRCAVSILLVVLARVEAVDDRLTAMEARR